MEKERHGEDPYIGRCMEKCAGFGWRLRLRGRRVRKIETLRRFRVPKLETLRRFSITWALIFCLIWSLCCIGCAHYQDSSLSNQRIGRSDSADAINTVARYYRHNANHDGDSLVQVVDCRKFMLSLYPGMESGHPDTVDCAIFLAYKEKTWRIGSAINNAKGQPPLSPPDTNAAGISFVWPSSLSIESIDSRSSTVAVDSAMVISLKRTGSNQWKIVGYRTRE